MLHKSSFGNILIYFFIIKINSQISNQSKSFDCKTAEPFTPCFMWTGTNLVSVKNGEPATLPCLVKNVDTTKTAISWWKENEMTEISLGKVILNARYKLSEMTEHDWSLIIKQSRMSDAGHYICQINLSTLMEWHVTLVVLKSKNADVRMDSNTEEDIQPPQPKNKYVFLYGHSKAFIYSKLILTCEVRYVYDNINAGIIWSHRNQFLNDSEKWKDTISIRWMGNLTLRSDLLLDPVLPTHSGKWSCHKIHTSRSDPSEVATMDLKVIEKNSKDIKNSSLKLTSESKSNENSSSHSRPECQIIAYSIIIFCYTFLTSSTSFSVFSEM